MYNDYDDYTKMPNNNGNNGNSGSNTGLLVIISVLTCIIVIAIIFAALLVTDVISFGDKEEAKTQVSDAGTTESTEVNQNNTKQSYDNSPSEQSESKGTPVNSTMYIDCNTSVTLRTGPSVSHPEIHKIMTGEPIYVIEYTDSEFAKVNHNENEGYVARQYISSTQPYVWDYNEEDVKNFVENSLYGYVNAMNTGDTSYVYTYFSDSLTQSEIGSVNKNSKVVSSEEIVSVNCHSVTRTSKTAVSVIRDSTIKVYYKDGRIRDVVEKYKYTVDGSNGTMKITSLKAM